MSEKILVLLSSYNGEKFIEEQIDTILAQEDVNVQLLVRDDGSTDRTPQILERYKIEGKLDYYLGINMGWKRSFMQLVQDAPDCDYYAFADQDDHWMPEKLKSAVKCLKSLPSGPKLYNCNGSLWKDGKIVGKVCEREPKYNKYSGFINPIGQGSTQVFNREMLLIVRSHMPQIEVPHDAWFARLSILLGGYYYDSNSYILYRQHGNNQLGADISSLDTFRRRIKMYSNRKKASSLDLIAKNMLDSFGNVMDKESYRICYTISNYQNSIFCYLKLLLSPKYHCDNLLTTIGFKYRVLVRYL